MRQLSLDSPRMERIIAEIEAVAEFLDNPVLLVSELRYERTKQLAARLHDCAVELVQYDHSALH